MSVGLHWPETYVLPDVDVLFHVLQQCGELLEGLSQTDAVLPASVGQRFKRLGAPRFLQRYAALHTQPTAITGASFHQTRNYAALYTQRTATTGSSFHQKHNYTTLCTANGHNGRFVLQDT